MNRPSAALERALLLTIAAHAAGMAAMPLLLLAGIPGGLEPSVAGRAAYVAAHPWLWRLGWLPWQLTAASDLWLCTALLATAWIPRGPAVFALLATAAAVVPDQTAQHLWTWEGVGLARQAVASGTFDTYLAFESRVFWMTAGLGPVGYILGALGWTWCFWAGGARSRPLLWTAGAAWAVFAAATAVVLIGPVLGPAASAAVGVGNAVAFILLMGWLLGVAEWVYRRRIPDEGPPPMGPWRHPGRGPVAWGAGVLANSRVFRAVGRMVPPLAMVSDVEDVVYVSFLIPAEAAERDVAPPLRVRRLGPGGRWALFTFLTYRHGHFGPRCFGPLRRLWPSPVQSNWRVHAESPQGAQGVVFLTTAITSLPHALAARFLAERIPMHIPERACVDRRGAEYTVELAAGSGSAPDARAVLREGGAGWSGAWAECFPGFEAFLAYCVPQQRALCVDPWTGRVVRQEIELDIPLSACVRLEGTVESRTAAEVGSCGDPVCFVAPRGRLVLLRGVEEGGPDGQQPDSKAATKSA